MKIGMLWFDNDSDTDLVAKVRRAADYYAHKYGKSPTVCFVHPSMSAKERQKTGRIEIRTNGMVLPHHFWIGVNGVKNSTEA